MSDADRQRIDKWLWFARVVKTRPLAQELAISGHVRLNGRKVDSAAQGVKAGDVLTIGLHGRVRVLKVLAFAERRGAFPEARLLYEDLAPVPAPTASQTSEEEDSPGEDVASPPGTLSSAPSAPRPVRGEGRPTKRERRRFDRLPDE